MKFEDVLQADLINEIGDATVIGIDIGSRQGKAVLLHHRNLYTALLPTGYVMQKTADALIEQLLHEAELDFDQIDYIVVTGYGRIALKFDNVRYQMVTEIACHGKGAHFLGDNIKTIIDIGGQDSKVIRIDPKDGSVVNFAMNDKCAAGTGTFLEKISNVLGLDVTEIGEASLKATVPSKIDSTCVVFAESEVVSNRAIGESVENIAAGIHQSVARRVNGLLQRVGIESNVLFTGGVSRNIGMKTSFEKLLGVKIAESKLDTVFAGALGAAVFAVEFSIQNMPSIGNEDEPQEAVRFQIDLTSYRKMLEDARRNFVNKTAGTKAYVGYTCVYTPIEVLAAANVSYIRLMHKGTQDEITAGESLTEGMICDFIKSIIGCFIRKEPEAAAIEKLYAFFTCTCMRATVDSIGMLYVPSAIYNVPKKKTTKEAHSLLSAEIKGFKEDLEKLTGEKIKESAIRENIAAYNLARKYMREIAEFRKEDIPLLSSAEYQEIVKGYFLAPVDKLLPELVKIKSQLEKAERSHGKRIRLLLTGGIIADGDNKITRALEELGVSVVAEDNCTGIRPMTLDVSEDGDVYDALASAYLGKAPCSRMDEKEDMFRNTLKLAQDYSVDGVVVYYLKFCTSYAMEEKMYREMFRKYDIPVIAFSADYSVGDEGQIKTRLEAFVEMLQQRQKLGRLERMA